MKSKLMRKGPPDEFQEDVKTLADLSDDVFKTLISHANKHAREGVRYDESLADIISEKCGISVPVLSRSLKAAVFLVNQEKREGDSVTAILADLVASNSLEQNKARELEARLRSEWESIAQNISEAIEISQELHASFPVISYCDVTCSVVTRFEPQVNLLTDSVESYSPKIPKITPVVQLQMDIYRYGDTDNISVALTAAGLDNFIKRLEFARIQLKVLSERLAEKT